MDGALRTTQRRRQRMIVRKVLITACAAALTTTPARAHPGKDPTDPPRSHGQAHQHARSHRCTPHGVAYVAAGTLRGHTLVLDGDRPARPTYSGDVTIDV